MKNKKTFLIVSFLIIGLTIFPNNSYAEEVLTENAINNYLNEGVAVSLTNDLDKILAFTEKHLREDSVIVHKYPAADENGNFIGFQEETLDKSKVIETTKQSISAGFKTIDGATEVKSIKLDDDKKSAEIEYLLFSSLYDAEENYMEINYDCKENIVLKNGVVISLSSECTMFFPESE